MKSVLISIRPQWCEKIVNGEKTIEVRKSAPKEVSFKAYIYCTKEKKQDDIIWAGAFGDRGKWNGRIIGEFICRGIMQPFDSLRLMAKESCLTEEDLVTYSNGKPLYGWRIADLKIYDKPRELSEFCIPCKVSCENCKNPLYFECWCEEKGKKIVTRPPQSWCYVEELCKAQN